MNLKFLDLATGLPHLWKHILGKIETHNSNANSHSDIRDALENKVDKDGNKVLSTNDYTTTEKNKLAGIATGANKTTVDTELSSSSTNPVQNKVINTALSNKVETSTYNSKISSIESNITSVSDALTAFENTKGTASGIAPLNSSSKIDSTYLPSYVDDVLEYAGKSNFPSSGETGKIYVDTSTNLTYRWSGTAYVEISPSLALGTTSSTAFRGDYGNTAYAHATAKGSAFSSDLYKITTNDEGHVIAATAVTKSDLTVLGVADASKYLPLIGGTLTGPLTISSSLMIKNNAEYSEMSFFSTSYDYAMARIIATSLSNSVKNYFSFCSYSRSSTDYSRLSYYEQFNFPPVDADRTTNEEYKIITTKNPNELDGRWLKLTGGTLNGNLIIKKDTAILSLCPTANSNTTKYSTFQAFADGRLSIINIYGDNRYASLVLGNYNDDFNQVIRLSYRASNGEITDYRIFHEGMNTPIPLTNGGTGATTANDALANLGAVSKAGDTITGNLLMTNAKINFGTYNEDGSLNGSSIYHINNLGLYLSAGGGGLKITDEEAADENGTGIASKLFYIDGFDNYAIFHTGLTVPISCGGTGATTAEAALTNLGISSEDQTWGGKKTFTEDIIANSGVVFGSYDEEDVLQGGNIYASSNYFYISHDSNSIRMSKEVEQDSNGISAKLFYVEDLFDDYAIFHSGMQIPTSNIASGSLSSLVSADATSQAENTAQLRNISVTTNEVTEGTTKLAAGQILIVIEE